MLFMPQENCRFWLKDKNMPFGNSSHHHQDWAEPKEEEQEAAWNAEKAAQARAMDEAGKKRGSYGAIGTVKFEPLPPEIGSASANANAVGK
jgi:hypothetical protein